MGNTLLASTWASHGVVGGNATSPAQWMQWWPMFFDGVSSTDNPEVDYMIFNDVGTTTTGNDVLLRLRDGTQTGIGGLPEQEFDQFRNATYAALPK